MQFDKSRSILVIAAGLTILSVAMSVSAGGIGEDTRSVSKQEKKIGTHDELVLRGKQLRVEIDRTYKKLTDTNSIKNSGMGRNFITDVVSKYIRVGMSFDAAETILRAAGFTIQPRIPNQYLPDVQKYDEIASIDDYAPTFFGQTSVDVSLRPRGRDDYSVIQNVSAEITRTFP